MGKVHSKSQNTSADTEIEDLKTRVPNFEYQSDPLINLNEIIKG